MLKKQLIIPGFNLSDGINQIINFGDNECDNQAMFELGENQYVVEMQWLCSVFICKWLYLFITI